MREEFEDIKGVIRICKSKNDRQYTDRKKNDKRINNYLQNTTQKTKDRATLINKKKIPLRTGGEVRCSVRVSSS